MAFITTRAVILLSLMALAWTMSLPQQLHQRQRRQVEGGASSHCPKPDPAEVERLLMNINDLHTSFFQSAAVRGSALTLEQFLQQHPDMQTVEKYSNIGSTTCNTTSSAVSFDPCPVQYRINYDATRIPQTLVEGTCLNCSECTSPGGTGTTGTSGTSTSTSQATSLRSCDPIQYYTKVLRRTSNCVYLEVYEPLTVGCACRTVTRTEGYGDIVRTPPQ